VRARAPPAAAALAFVLAVVDKGRAALAQAARTLLGVTAGAGDAEPRGRARRTGQEEEEGGGAGDDDQDAIDRAAVGFAAAGGEAKADRAKSSCVDALRATAWRRRARRARPDALLILLFFPQSPRLFGASSD